MDLSGLSHLDDLSDLSDVWQPGLLPGYLPESDNDNQLWYPGTYPSMVSGYLHECGNDNQLWYPGSPEYGTRLTTRV